MADPVLVLDHFLPYRLSYTSNLVSDTIAGTYEALFGLSIPEWRIVAVVAERGGVTQAEIGQRTRMDKVTVSRAAIALVGRRLLARSPHARDKRSHGLHLTDAGERLYADIAPKALALEARIFASFSPAEIEALGAMLRRIDAITLSVAQDRD